MFQKNGGLNSTIGKPKNSELGMLRKYTEATVLLMERTVS
jgi:hypothetical protein